MKCKVCDLTRPQKERMIPNNMEWYPNVEKWFIEHEPETDTYFIVAGYDCGYAHLSICDIKFCPLCGRKLK